jgi:hypothetical protein
VGFSSSNRATILAKFSSESFDTLTSIPGTVASTERFALCLSFTPRLRIWSVGSMKVRPT